MSIATVPRSDRDIQTAVQNELEWIPDVDAAGIGVAVEDGTVTLSGKVDDYSEQLAAERAALRVSDVSTVVDQLVVLPKLAPRVTETEIAEEVERALMWAINVPDSVKAEIAGHNVTLTGQVKWDFQRQAATRAVRYLRGVYAVNNMITLTVRPSAADAEERIKHALVRNALLDANHVTVTVAGNKAILTGRVRSWAEKKQAGLAAWASPHVTDVANNLVVQAY